VDAQAATSKPKWRATDSATETTLSLNEFVGLAASFFSHSFRSPSSAAKRGAGVRRVNPAPISTRPSSGAGRSAPYLHIERGPVSIDRRSMSAPMCSRS
jgi:hypothetical protein